MSELLGRAVAAYGRTIVSIVIAILAFAVWAVPTYLVAQHSAIAAATYATKKEAADLARQEANAVEYRMEKRIFRAENTIISAIREQCQ